MLSQEMGNTKRNVSAKYFWNNEASFTSFKDMFLHNNRSEDKICYCIRYWEYRKTFALRKDKTEECDIALYSQFVNLP